MDPADFYTGIVAELYGPLRSFRETADEYADFIRRSGQPALELGCGDGEPLLELRRRGLDVDGIDSSADMLHRLRRRASDEGLEVDVHQQKMQDLDLPRRYRSIFLAGATFNLLPDDATASQALRGIRRHLADGGTAMVPLFVPGPTPAEQIGRPREADGSDGAVLRVAVQSEVLDEATRTRHTTLRYERVVGGESTVVERVWTLHWHTPDGFRGLAAAAGLGTVAIQDDDGRPASPDTTDFTAVLTAN